MICLDTNKLKITFLPLGIALSVARVPLTAARRPLVLSLAALTLPFSPATLSAFSTHKTNGNIYDNLLSNKISLLPFLINKINEAKIK